MTAEANKVVAALQIRLPPAHPRFVAEKHVAFQGGGETNVTTVISARVAKDRFISRSTFGTFGRWRRWHEAAWVGPIRWQRRDERCGRDPARRGRFGTSLGLGGVRRLGWRRRRLSVTRT